MLILNEWESSIKQLEKDLDTVSNEMKLYLNGIDDRTLDEKVFKLRTFRSNVYELLNQIQHESLLVKSITHLLIVHNIEHDKKTIIEWNPRQTGTGEEPDVRITNANKGIMINVECTTSERPIGSIDKRMKTTLLNLSNLNGQNYYVVLTKEMLQRAETKIKANDYKIEVIRL